MDTRQIVEYFIKEVKAYNGDLNDQYYVYKAHLNLLDALEVAKSALMKGKRAHYSCEDYYYSCPQARDQGYEEEEACTCGADAHNARISESLIKIQEIESRE